MSSPSNKQNSSPPPKPPQRASSYFTFPVQYAVGGILRRLNSDANAIAIASPATTTGATADSTSNRRQSQLVSTANSLSHSLASLVSNTLSSSTTDNDMHGALHNPHRTASPFQPPPLTPITLQGWKSGMRESGKLLNRALAEEIRLLVPPRLQLVDEWSLMYSLEQNGVSLATLYKNADDYRGKRGGFVLVVKDASGGVFGAYLSDAPHPSTHFYGNGECFLWTAHVLTSLPDMANLPPPPSADTTNATRMTTIATARPKSSALSPPASGQTSRSGTSTPERIRFKAFPYSGINDYMIFCEHGFLSVGGG